MPTHPPPLPSRRCTKWEQGDIPEAHARFLGLRTISTESSVPSSQRAVATGDKHTQKDPQRSSVPGQAEKAFLSATASAGISWSKDATNAQDQEGVFLRGRGGGAEESKEQGRDEEAEDRFLTYWSEIGTDRPVKWRFFTGALFQASRAVSPEGAGMGRHGRILWCWLQPADTLLPLATDETVSLDRHYSRYVGITRHSNMPTQ